MEVRSFFQVLACLLVCLFSACGGSGNQEDLQEGAALKIYGGVQVAQSDFPQVVQVAIDQYRCSGTVIGQRSVLTAAHCFQHQPTSVQVFTAQGAFFASQVFVAPNVSSDGLRIYNDVAVVTTTEPLNIPPLPILAGSAPQQDAIFTVLGYGLNEEGVLGQLHIGSIFPDFYDASHLYDEVQGGQNTCPGDSGGPVLVTEFHPGLGQVMTGIYALTSTGTGNGCVNEELALYVHLQTEELLNFLVSAVPDVVLY